MRRASLWQVVKLSLRRDRRAWVFSAFGVAMGVGSLVFFVALGLGVGRVIREKIFPVDTRLLDVVPPNVSIGSFLGGGKLDQPAVDRLSKLPGVERVYRKMNVKVPAVTRYDGNFFGSSLRIGFELLAVGADPGLFGPEVEATFKDVPEGQPVPTITSSRLIEIYNKTFAPARKLPQLSEQIIKGFTFPVDFNRSFVAQTAPGPVTRVTLQVVALSDRAMLAGVTIPLDTAIRLNRGANVDAETFTSVSLLASDASRVPTLIDEVKKMGLQVDDQERRLAENAGAAIAITTAALALLSILICVLAAVNIAHALSASIRARAKEIGVMQAVGASRADVRNIVLAEAGVIGLAGGLIGTVGAILLAVAMNQVLGNYLPPFPFKPESFFAFPALVPVGGVALGLLAALGGAYFPSRAAAAMDPARTLAG